MKERISVLIHDSSHVILTIRLLQNLLRANGYENHVESIAAIVPAIVTFCIDKGREMFAPFKHLREIGFHELGAAMSQHLGFNARMQSQHSRGRSIIHSTGCCIMHRFADGALYGQAQLFGRTQ
jgi:hypothetical protein